MILADFDLYRSVMSEGVNDPGILKCVFLAGGPGSGKSYVASELFGIDRRFSSTMSSFGLKLVNSDTAFEYLLKKHGVDPKNLATIERDNPALWNALTGDNSPRSRAKDLTQAKTNLYVQGRLGLLIDGTGENIHKIIRQKAEAIHYGYDTMMVFVNTNLQTALARNAARSRQLPDSLVKEIWAGAQDALQTYQNLFSDNIIIVNNDGHGTPDQAVHKAIRAFMTAPIKNHLGREWMQNFYKR